MQRFVSESTIFHHKKSFVVTLRLVFTIKCFLLSKQGAAGANVLVGIQVPENEMEEFRNRAQVLGYEYVLVSEDINFKLLMQ